MRDYSFEILGSLPSSDAVAGVLSAPRSRKGDRIVLIVPTEGLTDHKRREKIQIAKDELEQGGMITFPSADSHALTDIFTDKAEKELKANISEPAFIEKMLDVMITESNNPYLVIDAQNRECFWGALRVMGADNQDMFAVAELGALKPEAKSKRVSKPIGDAHLLCGDILHFKGAYTFSDYPPGELINMVRRATKVKLPSLDLKEQAIASYFMRELFSNTGDIPWGHKVARGAARLRAKWSGGAEGHGDIAVFKDANWAVRNMNRMQEWRNAEHDEEYIKKFSGMPRLVVLRGDPQEVLKREFRETFNFDADAFDFDGLLQAFDEYGFEHLQFRGGIHKSPYDLALFETDFTDGEAGREFSFSTLVIQDSMGLTAYNFLKREGDGHRYILDDKKMCVRFDGHSADKISIINLKTDKTLSSGGDLAFRDLGDMAFMHTLSAIARINEPGFAPTTYESSKRGFVDIKKGKFPYFDYIGMDSFGAGGSAVRVGSQGKLEPTDSIMRRHLVRGHPRRYFDDEGKLVNLIMVSMHERGDERLGFVSKSYELK